MQVDPPTWALRGIRCECCAGQGALCFSACPDCNAVVLVCDEVGTVFSDPKNLESAVYGGLDDPSCRCPRCAYKAVSEFRNASAVEIQGAGFPAGSYE